MPKDEASAILAATPLGQEPDQDIIRSVVRAFSLLEVISLDHIAEVGELSEATGLPKPTVVRLVQTLVHAGYVRQISSRGAYALTSKLGRVASGFEGLAAVLEVGAPIADALTRDMLWPACITEREGPHMVVRYSTLPSSPYAHARTTVGKRLPLTTSANGKAWLAAETGVGLESPTPADGPMPSEAVLQRVRERGYAMRTPGRDPITNSIAAPVVVQGVVLATVGVTYFRRALRRSEIERLAESVSRAAGEVAQAYLDRSGRELFRQAK